MRNRAEPSKKSRSSGWRSVAKRGKAYRVGFGKPPRTSRFKPGESGNKKGRPKGSKNFATVISDELDDRVPISENGRRRKISKREVMIKQVVNKAAGGDLKAVQTILNETRDHDSAPSGGADLDVFDTPEARLVMAEIVRRIRSAEDISEPAPSGEPETHTPEPASESKKEE